MHYALYYRRASSVVDDTSENLSTVVWCQTNDVSHSRFDGCSGRAQFVGTPDGWKGDHQFDKAQLRTRPTTGCQHRKVYNITYERLIIVYFPS